LASAIAALMWLSSQTGLTAQQSAAGGGLITTAVPRLVWFSGVFRPADGSPPAPVESVTLSVYHDETGGEPIWQETQNVVIGGGGSFNVLVGSVTPDGLPVDLFASGQPRWLGLRFARIGEQEQPRVRLASVPYALKASDADTLGGRPASAYALSDFELRGRAPAGVAGAGTPSTGGTANPPFTTSTAGTAGRIGMFVDSVNLGDSVMTQSGARIGLGTTTPVDYFTVSFDDSFGAFTGLAVQNRNGGGNAASGMLFYDQSGALAQFQGFSNVSHEYRINNIASGGSINFLLGGSSKFLVAPSGNVGIGAVPALTDRLRVAGNASVDGNLVANGNIAAKYQDVAEWVETAAALEAGTVVIVDPTEPNRVLAAPKAYDTRVAGAVSRQPGLVLGEQSESRAMVAQSGRVRVKADASYGAIRIGDLLVTSPTPGHAMRSKPMRVAGRTMHRPGTLLGKALEALPSGKAEILVLLTLQ
jgi:hypothetical protein